MRSLQTIAQYYVTKFDRNRLVNWIVRRFPPTTPRKSRSLELLKDMEDLRIIFTTNWDLSIEQELGVIPLVQDKDYLARDWDESSRVVTKLHGSIDRPDTLVISEEDYVDVYGGKKNPCIMTKFASLVAERTLIFVGYSLSDQDIQMQLKNIRRLAGELARQVGGRLQNVTTTCNAKNAGPLVKTYGFVDQGNPLVVFNSTDMIEIAVNQGRADELFDARRQSVNRFRREQNHRGTGSVCSHSQG